ncbi:MAG: biotin--[acetyl-CoA-carboxylase] ligase, partial [Bavariicoccus seileri]|uniref:biotin--[acetyl-CoA-carboxylase] ligase n=1 Tax=Bavariicoccus seileri TaxID=549685 RepID=UPI003F8E52E8
MTIRDNILTYLLDHPDTVVSGQSLADHLGVSRNAVWKGFNQLREEGYGIISHSNKGYQLDQRSHLLDAVQIQYGITSLWPDLTINISEETTSTNDLAKQFAINHPGHSALFITNKQTKGRGRQGRSFYSHLNDGLYFSLVISPGNILPNDVTLYTIITATAVLQALEDLSGKTLAVKWVNDLFYDGRKIGGILCEATTDLETKQLTS